MFDDLLVVAAAVGAVNLWCGLINIHMNFVSHRVGGAEVVVIVIIDGLQCLTDGARLCHLRISDEYGVG